MTEATFRLFFEAAPHPYLLLRPDAAFTIVGVNERYLAATRTKRAEILGRGLFEVFPDNADDCTATGVSDLRTSLERVKREGVADVMGVQKYDIPNPEAAGSFEVKYWSPVNTPVFDSDGYVLFIIHHVEDVTEFIQSREQATRESSERIEGAQARADRMEAEVRLRASEVKEANRRIKAAMEELERRDAELGRLNEQLKELDRAKTAFFSNVSHEFRTPLTLMLGSLDEVLSDASAGFTQIHRDRLGTAQRNSLRLLKLVNTLLGFSRIEAGRAQAAFEPADLAAATAELASHFQSAFAEAGLGLSIDCPALPEPVYVDREMWEKIVLNLVSNAFKFTHSGGVTVSLSSAEGYAHLTGRDTGTGIPGHEIPNLFQRFHRVEGSQGRSYEGSGIGLALVKELVQLHGGTISAESSLGQGSAFHVAIPLGTAHLPAGRVREPRGPFDSAPSAEAFVAEALSWLPDAGAEGSSHESLESEGSQRAFSGADLVPIRPRVVLADDNADMRAYVARLLCRAGYEVEAARDGEQALAACLANPPDLVLTDVMMPRLDGFGLVARLRQDERTALLPIILLSARAGEEARVEGLKSGADDYIVKPFGSGELRARADAAVRLSRLRKEAMIRETEMALLRASFDSAAVGMAHVATDGRWLRVNGRLCEMTGYARAELLAKAFKDITHPADAEAVRNFPSGKADALSTEKRCLRKDGVVLWINLTASPVRKDDGTPDYFVCVIDDITARKQAEEIASRLAAIVESSSDSILSKTLDGTILSWNEGAERLFGYAAGEMIGQSIRRLIPPPRQSEEDDFLARIEAGERIQHYDTVRLNKDGRAIDVSVTISPIRDRTGSVVGVSKIVHDITERKRAEDTQRLLLAELDHRVKNTLATVQAIALQTLSTACDPAEFVESFNGRIRALGRAHGLLTRTSWQGADLATLIKEQLTLGAEATDWRVSSSGPQVLLEPQAALHLGLVLHELGTNARKYGSLSQPEGRLTTEWSLSSEAGHAELLLKWVESDGPPVAPPGKRSFGTTLIERSLRYALGGEARLTFAPTGVTCEISLPLPLLGNGAYSANLPERPQ